MGIQGFEYGKIPPRDIELEVAILGALLLNKKTRIEVVDILEPEMFYSDAHVVIYGVIKKMFNDNKTIDILTVSQELRAGNQLKAVGGAYYIAQLTRGVGSSENVNYHSAIIRQLWKKRKIIEITHEVQQNAFSDELNGDEIIDQLGVELINIDKQTGTYHISKATDENVEMVAKIKSGEISRIGISTMLSDIDKVINGLQSPDLIIVAGRPGMGKTAFALSVLSNISIDQQKPSVFFSLEMSASQLEFRLESMHSGVPYRLLQQGNINSLNNESYVKAQKKIKNSPIYIDDDPDLCPERIRTRALKLKMQYDIQVVFVDYIQLIEGRNKSYSRENEISKVSRSLKRLAKEIDVPVVALSQLNREVEKRKPPEPFLSDLRESGAIEQDADLVMLLYRPEYYGVDTIEKGGQIISTKDMCQINLAKHRNGNVGKVLTKFNSNTMRFMDFGEPEEVLNELAF
jgi:replicative DNA helicase